MLTSATSRSCSRCPSQSFSWSSPVSASTRYAAKAPASRRKSVLESEQSFQRKPDRWRRTSNNDSASSNRFAVSGRSVWENSAR